MKKYTITSEEYELMCDKLHSLENKNSKLKGYIEGLEKQLTIRGVVSSKPSQKSLRQIIQERRTNLYLTSEILKKEGKDETFFSCKYDLLDNILNEFDGKEEPN